MPRPLPGSSTCSAGRVTHRVTEPGRPPPLQIQLTEEGKQSKPPTDHRDARRQYGEGIDNPEIDRLVDVLNSVFDNLSSEDTK